MPEDQSAINRVISTYRAINDMYGSVTALRAAVAAVPVIGGSIDMLLEGGITGIRLGRVEDLVEKLRARVGGLETTTANLHGEEFADLIAATFRRASETRSEGKRARFAQIIANQVASPRPWGEADAAVKLLGDLEDIHLEILRIALGPPVNAPKLHSPHPIISPLPDRIPDLDEDVHPVVHLPAVLTGYTPRAIRLACFDLVSRGLLFDTGIATWAGRPMQQLAATDGADWFARWISDNA